MSVNVFIMLVAESNCIHVFLFTQYYAKLHLSVSTTTVVILNQEIMYSISCCGPVTLVLYRSPEPRALCDLFDLFTVRKSPQRPLTAS